MPLVAFLRSLGSLLGFLGSLGGRARGAPEQPEGGMHRRGRAAGSGELLSGLRAGWRQSIGLYQVLQGFSGHFKATGRISRPLRGR